MSALQFAEPQWVHAIWAVLAALALLVALDRRGGRALERFVSPALQPRLVAMPSGLRRGLRLGLLGLAGLALVVALMRPQWGVEFISAPRVGAEIMIALDVSRSMLAEDVAPNRLERAKAEIRDLLGYLDGDQVGLIAFAGRASVLCPLTPDFGFLRLVLDNVDVRSAGRGGTRLEEPIRKAVQGFGGSGELSRVILLITDGEDHDSFPVDAAKEAALRGIRILAIGFGDEDGSPITLTDPQSGARTTLRDANGQTVQSRLDGDLLRELAVVTDGAYVPAGTGVLDLESIFEAHIRPLMRAEGETRGRTLQQEGFQWAILLALVALLASVALQGGRARFLAGLLLAIQLGLPGEPLAQATPAPDPSQPDAALSFADGADPQTEGEGRERLLLPEDPREAYNRGLDALESAEHDDAERLFEAARSRSGSDAEARFRASFNLAWVDIQRAEAQMESDPEAALDALERAADWLREAVALRPSDQEARRNLEIVLARALALADSLAEREPGDLEARLAQLIEGQRAAGSAIRTLLEGVQQRNDPGATDAMRPQFKQVAVEERRLLAEAGRLAEIAGQELEALEGRAQEELGPEDQMRKAQLSGLLHYLHRSRERMGQTRSQLRQRQADRAHSRAAAALSNLKRAREQLEDPVRVLDGVIGDAAQLSVETRTRASAAVATGPRPPGTAAPAPPPAWLTFRYLAEAQQELGERSQELGARFAAGLDQAEAVTDPEQLALLEQVGAAQPHVEAAHAHFAEALGALESEDAATASEAQLAALSELALARERFLDLKRLIEVSFADEQRIGSLLAPDAELGDIDVREYAPALAELQARNLERTLRMAPMLESERRQIEAAAAGEQQAASGQAPAPKPELERLDVADAVVALVESAMRGAGESLAQLAESPAALAESQRRVESARKGLELLRRLFFSIVEHIRDAAERQQELSDQTAEQSATDPSGLEARLGPQSHRQRELGAQTEKLAEALHEQSFADPAEGVGGAEAQDPAAAQQLAEKLTAASELVLGASEAMLAAATALGDEGHPDAAIDPRRSADGDASGRGGDAASDQAGASADAPPANGSDAEAVDLAAAQEHQGTALQKLAEALALLQPPDQQEQQQQQGQQQEQQEQQSGQDEQQQPEPSAEQQPEQAGDPSQLLQSVRDREAERHRRQGEREQRGYDPVEKDW